MSSFRVLFAKRDQKQQLVDINEIIRLVLESLSSELKDYQVELRSELLSALPHVHGNGSQLQEVVSNLIVNAIEAMGTTSDRSRVLHVRTELRDRQAVAVSIKDSGPGIDNDRLDRIFTAFVTTKSDGMGLGLAICRMIIEHHGGQLTASSDGKSGALFQFVLPVESLDKVTAGAALREGSGMVKFIAQANIAHFREKLADEQDETQRQNLLRLLAEEQAKLAALKNDPPKKRK